MIELVDTLPDVTVNAAEYQRLLGYPRDVALTDRAQELADRARSWYATNGQPWVYAREAENLSLDADSIFIEGRRFTSKRLHKTLAQAEAHGAVLVAVSAGPEIEAESQRLWAEEKPDEYFFTEIYGSAIVEHLVASVSARLCAWCGGRGLAVLPHYSPGYPEWDIGQQSRLLDLIRRTKEHLLPCQLDVLASGMLRPKKSLLAVFGLTRHTDRVRSLAEMTPCENCSLSGCAYRRVPQRTPEVTMTEILKPLNLSAKYSVNLKALKRWSEERLKIDVREDGTIDAVFRYDGTTCSAMGRTLKFDYSVKLGPKAEGFVIREQRCDPTPGDDGYTFMCRYMNNREHLMVSIDHEKPLLGRPLDEVLTWERPNVGAGCYCEPKSRTHKWGIALETIHFALAQREKVSELKSRPPETEAANARME